MDTLTDTDWDASAAAWIAAQGADGDFGRRHVLDAPMRARVAGRGFARAVDIGCGEGRFCRWLADAGIATTGIDPTAALIAAARQRHPAGDYRIGRAEILDLPDAGFDLVVSYLSLIDIADLVAGLGEMNRVLADGGTLLIANQTGFSTAWSARRGHDEGKGDDKDGRGYLDEFANWESWDGIRVRNWHRPLSRYMALLLGHGLVLRHFDEPEPSGGDAAKQQRYRQLPHHFIMEWQKPPR